eukprot:GHVT01011054.1.p1 GENE.GHVT01011054.1~~GHVT01011054.1.p1  ORF type:complete len:238 (-),score=10.63 GHVT01011054.1:20-733(-)
MLRSVATDVQCAGMAADEGSIISIPLRLRVLCQSPVCGALLKSDVHYMKQKHVKGHYPKSDGAPYENAQMVELWHMDWVGCKDYFGGCAYMQGLGLLKILYERVNCVSRWSTRICTASMIYKQIVSLEFFGGATINVHDLKVLKVVREGLQRMLLQDPQDFDLNVPLAIPPPGTEKCPLNLPLHVSYLSLQDYKDATKMKYVSIHTLVEDAVNRGTPCKEGYQLTRDWPLINKFGLK